MNKIFKYCILNYVHSQALDERINIAILFFFPSTQQFFFRFNIDIIKKIKIFYPNLDTKIIDSYLNTIDKQITDKQSNKDLFRTDLVDNGSIYSFLDNNVLKFDAKVKENYHFNDAITKDFLFG